MVVLIGNAEIKSESLAEFMKLATGMLTPSRAEPGCISYDFFSNRENENQVVFVEEWHSGDALEFHFTTPHFKEFIEMSATMLVADPVIKIYSVDKVHQM